MNQKPKILIYGYGNPGRQDDGLGISLAGMLEDWIRQNRLDNISVEMNYQLNIEDSATISDKDLVIFADASQEELVDFSFDEILPSESQEFSMHSISANYVLFLCESIFNKKPEAYILKMHGYEWELKEGLSEKAVQNLGKAFEFIIEYLLRLDNEAEA